MTLPMPDPICDGCERPLSIHRLFRWAVDGPIRAYCRPDLTLESPCDDNDVLEALAEGRAL